MICVEVLCGILVVVAAIVVGWIVSIPLSGSFVLAGGLCGLIACVAAAILAELLTRRNTHPARAPERHVISVLPYGAAMGVLFGFFWLTAGFKTDLPGGWAGFFAGLPAAISYGLLGTTRRRMKTGDYVAFLGYLGFGVLIGLLIASDDGLDQGLCFGTVCTLAMGLSGGRFRWEHLPG